MMPLRAFLILRCRGDEWEVSVHRDLEAVLKAWKDRPEPALTSGVLHIGFDRPPSVLFESIVAGHPGRMFLTATAKYALPRGFETSHAVLGSAEGHPVFLALKGWGYGVSEDELTKIEAVAPKSPIPEQAPEFTVEGWVREFIAQHPEARSALQAVGICNEHTYVSNECNLDRDIRCQVGLFRFRTLVGVNTKDHLAIVQAFPPWLLDRGVGTLSVSVRIANVFQIEHIKTARDLLNYSSDELIRLQNFGRKSLDGLRSSLLDALNEGPSTYKPKCPTRPREICFLILSEP
jgi:Bacterial RNA polymerase, alpha chain C terminal domain